VLLPNIFKGEMNITNDQLNNLFISNSSELKPIETIYYSPNKVVLKLNGDAGFVAISEHLLLFNGWHAKVDGVTTEIFDADGVISAVYVGKGSQQLELTFMPISFIIGAIISGLMVVLIILYFIFYKKIDFSKKKEVENVIT
jgi:uncharacterized membrane protein YfhO